MTADIPAETFELVALEGGIYSLRSHANGQTFHPVIGPAAEALGVHVAGTRLVERTATQPGELFVVWDVGLGAAANALTAVDALLTVPVGRLVSVALHSFDHGTAALSFALENAAALGYPRGHEATLRTLQDDGYVQLPLAGDAVIGWKLHLRDFPAWLTGGPTVNAPDAIFYDPYSPYVNPEMWTLETFEALFARLRPDTPCLLTTYTRSTAARVTLLLAGFHVGVGGATGEKDETTVAANDPALLARPLDRRWLEKRVYASTNGAPLRRGAAGAAAVYTRQPISDEDYARLQAHPQFR